MATVTEPVNRLTFKPVAAPAATSGQVVFPDFSDGSRPVVSKIRWFSQTIEITSSLLFSRTSGVTLNSRIATKRIISRLFQNEAVDSAEVNRSSGTLTIRLAQSYITTAYVLEQITGSLAGSDELGHNNDGSQSPVILWAEAPSTSFHVTREGPILTTWKVESQSNSQIVISNPSLIESSDLRSLTESLADELPNVSACKIDRKTGRIALKFQPGQVPDKAHIIESLELLSSDARQIALLQNYPRSSYKLPIATLAVATLSQWWLPGIWPLAGAMVTMVNWRMVVRSFHDLRQGTLGLPMLTTLIITGTALGGAFFASALMSVMARYWQNQYATMLNQARRTWLGNLALPSGSINLALPDGSTIRKQICCLKSGNVIELAQGDSIPADGICISGSAKIHYPHGCQVVDVRDPSRVNRVFAGGQLESGLLRVQIEHLGFETRLARIRNEVLTGSGTLRGETALNHHGQKFAEKTILPTLALAGFGLATGGVGTAVAVMRPDYATGVGLGQGLERLRLSSEAFREGFLIRDHEAFDKIHLIDLWISENPEHQLPVKPGQVVAEVVSPDRIDLIHGPDRLTLQGFSPIHNDIDRMRLIHLLRSRGLKIGWSGDAVRFPNTAKFADLALSTNHEIDSRLNPSAIISLQDSPADWNIVHEIFKDEKRESERVRKLALIPNIAAIAGAFTMGFTSLSSVILTNAGIWTVFQRTSKKAGSLRTTRHERQPI